MWPFGRKKTVKGVKKVNKEVVEKKSVWTDGLTEEDLRKKLFEAQDCEEHWKKRAEGDMEELRKPDGRSCTFCVAYDILSCAGCPLFLKTGQLSCSGFKEYRSFSRERATIGESCCISVRNAASSVRWAIHVIVEEIEEALKALIEVGNQVRVEFMNLGTEHNFTGEVVSLRRDRKDFLGCSEYSLDVKRDDGTNGGGQGGSYRIFNYYEAKITKLPPKCKVKENLLEVGDDVAVTGGVGYCESFRGKIVAVNATHQSGMYGRTWTYDIEGETEYTGKIYDGKGGSFRLYDDFKATVVKITLEGQIKELKEEVGELKATLSRVRGILDKYESDRK